MSGTGPILSAVICTYNRADLLVGAIESLARQTLPPEAFEILVVDNASTDRTASVVEECIRRYASHRIRYLHEARQGLGYARNTGYRQAQGAYVAYLDDDARAKEDWLEKALACFAEHPELYCVGGVILPFYTTPKPEWFEDRYEIRMGDEPPHWLGEKETLSGSNMVWRKDVLQGSGGFGVDFGVKGEQLSIGEETLLFKRLWQTMDRPRFYFNPELVVWHWVPDYKMRVRYHLKRYFIIGQDTFRMDFQPGMRWRVRVAVRSAGAVILRGVAALLRLPRYRHWQNWAIAEGRHVAPKVGAFLAALGLAFAARQK